MQPCSAVQGRLIVAIDLHPDPHAIAEITLGGRGSEGAVGSEDTVVHEPGGGVELGEESLDAPAEAVLRVGNSLEDGGTNDRNSGLLIRLAVARAQSLPSNGSAVATVEDVQGLEWNVGLFAVVGAELLARGESHSVDNVRALATTVADDVDGGAPVDEILGKCLFGEFESVALNKLLEDTCDCGGVLVGQALVTLVLALVPVPGTGMTPAPGASGLPVAWSSLRSGNRSGCGDHGGDHGRSDCDDSCRAHVDGLDVRLSVNFGRWCSNSE